MIRDSMKELFFTISIKIYILLFWKIYQFESLFNYTKNLRTIRISVNVNKAKTNLPVFFGNIGFWHFKKNRRIKHFYNRKLFGDMANNLIFIVWCVLETHTRSARACSDILFWMYGVITYFWHLLSFVMLTSLNTFF